MSNNLRNPLFVEPTEEMQREDAWSGPYGFLLGGWALPSKEDMSRQYLDAANLLVNNIKNMHCEDFTISNPVLFLYRHALELKLKSMLDKKAEHHRLDALSADLEKHIAERYGQKVPAWITDKLKELAEIDPTSMAFRYGEDKYNGEKRCTAVVGEVYVGVLRLQQVINTLYEALTKASNLMRQDYYQ